MQLEGSQRLPAGHPPQFGLQTHEQLSGSASKVSPSAPQSSASVSQTQAQRPSARFIPGPQVRLHSQAQDAESQVSPAAQPSKPSCEQSGLHTQAQAIGSANSGGLQPSSEASQMQAHVAGSRLRPEPHGALVSQTQAQLCESQSKPVPVPQTPPQSAWQRHPQVAGSGSMFAGQTTLARSQAQLQVAGSR